MYVHILGWDDIKIKDGLHIQIEYFKSFFKTFNDNK